MHLISIASLLLLPLSSALQLVCARHPAVLGQTRHPGVQLAVQGERLLLIDGNNLMGHRKVTKGREQLAAKISGIRGSQVIIVFDGKRGEAATVSGSDPQVVVTAGGDEATGAERQTADEWIEAVLEEKTSKENVIEVVTADRGLREIAHSYRSKTINPTKFWRRYLQRLKGLKNDYRNSPKEDMDEQ
jgi:predicted RNA-binding protein with PIN domain